MLEGEELNILHVVPGLDNPFNGIAVAAKLIAEEQAAEIVDARGFGKIKDLAKYEEVWVHSCWLPMTLKACRRVVKAKRPLIRMTHANLDPVRLRYHAWKKWLVGPIERYWLRKADRIVATCEAEKEWIEAYLGKRCPLVEVSDIKRFFKMIKQVRPILSFCEGRSLHLLYLGRRHPLKGVEYLEVAVSELNEGSRSRESKFNSGIGNFSNVEGLSVHCSTSTSNFDSKQIELKIVSNVFGDEKEKVWAWCDVLVLPTLSENFGLVIAEALERGKRVITTDGAPAWGDGNDYDGRLIYLKGYRDGTSEERVQLLKNAILKMIK